MDEVRVKRASLQNIADAIREKTEEQGSYYPADMADAIGRIKVTEMVIEPLQITANGVYEVTGNVNGYNPITVDVPPTLEELEVTANGEYTPTSTDGFSKVTVNTAAPDAKDLVITGNCLYRFSYNGWNWVIEKFGDNITTKDIYTCAQMFADCNELTDIPFQINVRSCSSSNNMFYNCAKLNELPAIRGTLNLTSSSFSFESMFNSCANIKDVENVFTSDMLEGFSSFKITSSYSTIKPVRFSSMNALRKIPSWWYKFQLNPESTAAPTASYSIYYMNLHNCYSLDEALDVPVWVCAAPQTSNMMGYFCNYAYRLKALTFATNEDGSPKTANWKSQTIDLLNVGYANNELQITNYNSGITLDKVVKDDATYQTLKNDPDWFTTKLEYSRYNHDSAVSTINSLPDTSAYLATAGGTNTIKFKGIAGSLTDGGAINTMTAEEIAVATAKGWTVTLS